MSHNLPPDQLEDLLRANAAGVYAAEAATELLIAHDRWLRRPDFTEACVGIGSDREDDWFAWVDWHQVPTFLEDAPFSGSEGRILRIAAELAGVDSGLPLAELLTALDDTNSRLVVAAVAHARRLDIEVASRPGPRSQHPWGAIPTGRQLLVSDADLGVIEHAIGHPGRYTPRTTDTEPVPAWQARAVLVALTQRGPGTGPHGETGPSGGPEDGPGSGPRTDDVFERATGSPRHRCRDHLDRIGHGAYPFECVVCGKRYSTLDLEDWAAEDRDAGGEAGS